MVQSYKLSTEMQRKVCNRGSAPAGIIWQKPETGWIAINTDGAVARNTEAGCGSLMRNSEGDWLGGFIKNVGRCTVLTAEFWGIYGGLKLAQSKGYIRIEVQVDNQEAADIITGKKTRLRDTTLVRKIKTTVDSFMGIKVLKINRKANKSVDAMAKYSLQLQGERNIKYTDCPEFLYSVINSEASGIG